MPQYRLEMGCKGAPKWGGESTLYDYWGTAIADEITAAIGEKSGGVLVNCASTEYSKAVLPHLNDSVQLVECVFKDDGRIKSVYAKRARGLMAVRNPNNSTCAGAYVHSSVSVSETLAPLDRETLAQL